MRTRRQILKSVFKKSDKATIDGIAVKPGIFDIHAKGAAVMMTFTTRAFTAREVLAAKIADNQTELVFADGTRVCFYRLKPLLLTE